MAEPPRAPEVAAPRLSLAQTASMGARWTTAQGIINKLATMVAILIVANAVSPTEFGLASVVVVASGFVMVFPVLVMADVIVTHQHHKAAVTLPAWKLTFWTGIAMALTMIGTAPIIAIWYPQYEFLPLAMLLAISGLRPIAEAFTVRPLARLRIGFHYRDIAIINGAIHLGASVLTVIWAIIWPSAAAIVIPQVMAAVAKGVWFSLAVRRIGSYAAPRVGRLERRRPDKARAVARQVGAEFGLASLAQYVHTAVSGLPVLVVSRFASTNEIGQFSFAFALAYQASAVLISQLAPVLQPIFGRLKSDPQRQVRAFLRVVGLISAVMAPVALLQAALAEPLLTLFFGSKWLPAIPIFVAISVGQAFSFHLAPATALLKAQGRYGTYFLWQVLQGVASLAFFLVAIRVWGPVGVAWADTAVWLVTMPTIIWLGCRATGVGMTAVVRTLLTPLITALPIALAVWGLWEMLPGQSRIAAGVALLVLGPAGLFASLLAIRVFQPTVARELASPMRRVLQRVPRIGRPIADWFAPVPSVAPSAPESSVPPPVSPLR